MLRESFPLPRPTLARVNVFVVPAQQARTKWCARGFNAYRLPEAVRLSQNAKHGARPSRFAKHAGCARPPSLPRPNASYHTKSTILATRADVTTL